MPQCHSAWPTHPLPNPGISRMPPLLGALRTALVALFSTGRRSSNGSKVIQHGVERRHATSIRREALHRVQPGNIGRSSDPKARVELLRGHNTNMHPVRVEELPIPASEDGSDIPMRGGARSSHGPVDNTANDIPDAREDTTRHMRARAYVLARG